MFGITQRGILAIFPNLSTIYLGLIAGIIAAIGFKSSCESMASPAALMSIVVLIAGTYPVVSSAICIPLFKEYENLILPKFVIGTALVIIGVYMVSTSTKKEPTKPASEKEIAVIKMS
jgi:FtsH-binding integral membrane protein